MTNVETLTVEANDTVKAARAQYVDNPRIKRIVNNVERTTVTLNQNLDPMLKDGRQVAKDARKLTTTLASDGQIRRYNKITRDVSEIANRGKLAAADAQAVVAPRQTRKGYRGSIDDGRSRL